MSEPKRLSPAARTPASKSARPAHRNITRLPTVTSLSDSYLASMRRRGLRPDTIRSTRTSLEHYARYAEVEGAPALEVARRADIEAWVDWQMTHAKPSSIGTRLTNIKGYLTWLVDEEEIEANVAARVLAPTKDETKADLVTKEEMQQALRTLQKAKNWRDLALISVLYDTGLRVGETTEALLDDLDPHEGLLTVHAATTKGRRSRTVALSPTCVANLDRYIRRRDDDHPWVFVGIRGQMSRNGVWNVTKRIFAFTGKTVGPHDLRHTSASHAAPQLSESEMMSLYGWRSPSMARHYTRQVADELAIAAHRRASPLDRLGR